MKLAELTLLLPSITRPPDQKADSQAVYGRGGFGSKGSASAASVSGPGWEGRVGNLSGMRGKGFSKND